MRYTDAVSRLESALRGPLPGVEAQRQLAPVPAREWPAGMEPARVRHAAGLLLLFPSGLSGPLGPSDPFGDVAHIVVTLRADQLRHGGQISLPGGVMEPDESVEDTALREADEEIGLASSLVRTLGRLSPVDIHVSGFRLHPVIGVAEARPVLRPAAGEVARVIEIPVADLLDPRALTSQVRHHDGRVYEVPTLVAQGAEIWGATAMVVAEFLSLLGWQGRSAR